MLVSLPVASAFAAPATQAVGGSNLEESWGNKLRQLQSEVTFFNNFQTKPGQNRNAQPGQYLDKYRTTLAAAQGLVISGSGFDSNGRLTNEGQARRSNQLLGQYLSTIRDLKDKIGNASGDENNSNTGNNGGNAGIPVTGGAANTNQNAGQNNNQNNSPAKLWGPNSASCRLPKPGLITSTQNQDRIETPRKSAGISINMLLHSERHIPSSSMAALIQLHRVQTARMDKELA